MNDTMKHTTMTRSRFLRCCAGGAIAACTASMIGLQSCSSVPMAEAQLRDKELAVPLSAFGESTVLQIRRNASMPTDILLVKEGQSIRALLLRCTHKGCQVQVEEHLLVCPCHGSEFSMQGEVLSPPAARNLDSYATRVDATIVYVQL